MTIEVVKDISSLGQITYYVKVNGKFQSGTVRHHLHEVMEVYENVKENHSKARVEVLIREEI